MKQINNSNVSGNDIRVAFKSLSDVIVDDTFEQACVALCTEFGLDANGLTTEWELLAMKYSDYSSHDLLRRLREKLGRDAEKNLRNDTQVQNTQCQVRNVVLF
jgi:hypothetical protein